MNGVPGRCMLFLLLLMGGCVPTVGLALKRMEIRDRRPSMSWEAFEYRDEQGRRDAVTSEASNITYDLRVYREADGALVVDRRGIPKPQYRLPTALPRGRYRWTVRPRFVVSGRRRVGTWSAKALQPSHVVVPPPVRLYRAFKIR